MSLHEQTGLRAFSDDLLSLGYPKGIEPKLILSDLLLTVLLTAGANRQPLAGRTVLA